MKPKKYCRENENERKPVELELGYDGYGNLELKAVFSDVSERCGVTLLTFYDDRISSEECVKRILEEKGYDTSFCRWAEDGSIVLN